MNTQPDNLPFIKDPLFDYIITEADRKNFAPKLATDEIWINSSKVWEQVIDNPFFGDACLYRRRKTSGWDLWKGIQPNVTGKTRGGQRFIPRRHRMGESE